MYTGERVRTPVCISFASLALFYHPRKLTFSQIRFSSSLSLSLLQKVGRLKETVRENRSVKFNF